MQQVGNLSTAEGTRGTSPLCCECAICGYRADPVDARQIGAARGNTRRFRDRKFLFWQCPGCQSIHNLEPWDFADLYHDYPLNTRRLDLFARGTLRNLLRRLETAGLSKTQRILDYGCGNGVLLQYLRERGYASVTGYDPFVGPYSKHPHPTKFDVVIANDVIEHVHDPRAMLLDCLGLTKPGGLLYVGTADAAPVDMNSLDSEITRLHPPFHRVIITAEALLGLGQELGLRLAASYQRSYMDTLRPFSNYRFLDELLKASGHDMEAALSPEAGKLFLRHPRLFFYAFFGYLLPSAREPAAVWRRH